MTDHIHPDGQANNDHGAGQAICDQCGELKPVCCGEFDLNDDESEELQYSEALCLDCCPSQKTPRRLNVGTYERMDCDV